MASTHIMTTEVEYKMKAGDNFPATAFPDTSATASGLQAESIVNCITRNNFSDTYATDNVDVRYIISNFVSCFIAIDALNCKPTGEDGAMNRIEFEDRINVLRDSMLRAFSILRDQKVVTFINAAWF